jgi:hypothetical protein
MPHRVPYEILAPQAELVYQKVLSARTQDEMAKHFQEYSDFIEACGWTLQEYDREQLRRVDEDWDTTPKPN